MCVSRHLEVSSSSSVLEIVPGRRMSPVKSFGVVEMVNRGSVLA